jgi:hypothetical protein
MKKLLLTFSYATMLVTSNHVIAQQESESGVIYCDRFSVTKPLIELAKENPVNLKKLQRETLKKNEEMWESKDRKKRKPQNFEFSVEDDPIVYGNDSSLFQNHDGGRPTPQTRTNINGVNTGSYPHDPSGAADDTYYIQAVNATTVRIINKTTDATVTNFSLGTLWNPDTPNDGDPIIMYDRFADRWFLSQFGVSGNRMYIAISATSDPLGSWYTYSFTSPQFPDYLKFSIWRDGYYMTANTNTQRVFAFERDAMLAGSASARSVYASFNPPDGGGFFCPLPADADGNQGLPTSGACPIFSYSDNGWGGGNIDAIQIYQAAVNWVPTTPTMTISFVQAVPTSPFDGSYNASWNDIPQPGTTQKLDGIGGVLNYRAQWRKWSGYNTVVLTWGVKVSTTQRSVMWAELRQNPSTGAWTMHQQSIYSPDNYYRWIGSIAMDDLGNIALCYTKSGSTTVYPGLYYTGRLATDPLNEMTFAESTAIAGTVSQTGGVNRWGDYSHTALDPDGSTFWHTAEWGGGTASNPKRTRIYSFQLLSATSAVVSITSNDADNVVCAGSSVTFTATPTNGGTNPTYQWQIDGVNVGTNSPTFTSSSLANGDVVTCIMTSDMPGVTNNPATSNPITVTVINYVTPQIVVNGNTTICQGVATLYSAGTANAGSSPTYQWQVNGMNVGSNTSSYSTAALTNGSVITCTLTSSANCASPATVTSAPVTITVNPAPATPSITTSGGVLTSSSASGNQWYLNGNIITGATGQSYTPTSAGNYTVVVTQDGCASAASNSISNASIEEIDPFGLTIYPNPNQGEFSISFNAAATNNYTLKIYDEVGKIVLDEKVQKQNGLYEKEISLKVASGIYNIVLSDGKSEIAKKIVIKK